MKKNFVCGLIASISMVSISAYADPVANDASSSALTTKGYVDAGLQYVYDIANGTSNGAVKTLQSAVGTAGVGETPGTGLIGDVEALQDTVGDANGGLVKRVTDLESTTGYAAGTGVVVTPGENGDPSTIGLNIGTVQNNTTYVFKTDASGNGTWQAMEVEDSWNPSFLTGGQ